MVERRSGVKNGDRHGMWETGKNTAIAAKIVVVTLGGEAMMFGFRTCLYTMHRGVHRQST